MLFYVLPPRTREAPPHADYPCVTLQRDRWNDFGWVTQFHAKYWNGPHDFELLGPVKILQRDAGDIQVETQLPSSFERLDEQYCSLGQERRYYVFFHELEGGAKVLEALRDVVVNPSNSRDFENTDAFKDSLLRYSEAVDNFRTAREIFGYAPAAINGFFFRFEYLARGFASAHSVTLDFTDTGGLPHRVMAFVGKNGTGKTAVMAEMARQLSGVAELKSEESGFWPERPSFSRVLAVSYSPFGPFRYPQRSTSSYRYCGLLDRRGRMNQQAVGIRIIEALGEIREEDREIPWFEALSTAGLFRSEPSLEADLLENPDATTSYKILRRLSSGHFYTAAMLTEITAYAMERSLIMIDEPELYLHPNMVSGLMRALDDLLGPERFESYAIVATHSPIVIQEIPGRNVRHFARIDDQPICNPLEFESFGENLTAIVNEVFGATREDKNYMRILERLAQDRSEPEVAGLFDGELGLNASVYLRAIVRRNPEGLVE